MSVEVQQFLAISKICFGKKGTWKSF